MKVRQVSYSSFLIVAQDIYQVLQSEDQGFYFYFIFYAVNYRIGGCFFILLICSLEYFFLTTVTTVAQLGRVDGKSYRLPNF